MCVHTAVDTFVWLQYWLRSGLPGKGCVCTHSCVYTHTLEYCTGTVHTHSSTVHTHTRVLCTHTLCHTRVGVLDLCDTRCMPRGIRGTRVYTAVPTSSVGMHVSGYQAGFSTCEQPCPKSTLQLTACMLPRDLRAARWTRTDWPSGGELHAAAIAVTHQLCTHQHPQ